MIKYILSFLLVSTAPVYAKPAAQAGFVKVRDGVELWVEHFPAGPGRPTVFLANGLTYSTKQYEDYIRALRKLDPDIGIVAWDMQGMGQTLLKVAPWRGRLPIETQIEDLHALVRKLNLKGPKSLMGLSYGGALELYYASLYPNDFDNFIGFAPMVERIPAQDQYLNWRVVAHRAAAPWDPSTDEELYDLYLRQFVQSTFWIAEPIILENPYKLEAIFRMVQGVKNFNAFQIADKMPKGKIHVIAAMQDEHVKLPRLNAFWETLPEAARASYLRLDHSLHKIPEAWPKISAAWTLHILNQHPDLQRGLTFKGNPFTAEAKSGAIRIPLDKVENCESLLGTVSEPKSR